jgi:inorganic pyrophosphatase
MKLPQPFIKGTDLLNVIIETPKGSKNKYAIDLETRFFHLKKSLPAGMVFPFDFGFIPYTHAEDGDPLDVLVLTDAPTFPGCVVDCKVIGIIKVEQEKQGKQFRNDRVVAVHVDSRSYSSIEHMDDLEDGLVREIIHFFASYNQLSEDVFKPLGNGDPKEAIALIKENLQTSKV